MSPSYKYQKTIEVLLYLINKSGGSLDKLKTIKLLWLADRYHLLKFGSTISQHDYYTLPYGPVPSAILKIIDDATGIGENPMFKNFKLEGNTINANKDCNTDYLSRSEIEALDIIFEVFKLTKPKGFFDISHNYPEYLITNGGPVYNNKRTLINPLTFFEQNDSVHDIFKSLDVEAGKFLFDENMAVESLLHDR